MRGNRTPKKPTARGTPSRDSHNSRRNVWVVNDGGHPKSPLSIERLPRNIKRNISRVARVKPRCKTMARKRADTPKDFFPFFIDKSPDEELVDDVRNRERSFTNESVLILDSPSVSTSSSNLPTGCSMQELRRQDSVDTVDLCSEEEEEQSAEITRGTKRKKGRERISGKRRRLHINAHDDHQPDIIVLDDEDECTVRSSNNDSIVVESMHVKASQCKDKSSISGFSETPASVANATAGPSRRQNSTFRSKYLDKPLAVTVPHKNGLVHSRNTNHGPTRNIYTESESTKADLSDTVGSNVFNPCGNVRQTGLRPIIIDGCNVAIAHGGNRLFSVKGLCICVEYFLCRGHCQVVALVPLHQRSKVSPQDRDVLESLKNDSHLVFTPSRFIDNRLISSYDDRYIVQYAAAVGGVIVSRDNYRDLLTENPAWRDTITNRLLMPTWVGDILMFPVDPLGKTGPSLDDFLRFPNK